MGGKAPGGNETLIPQRRSPVPTASDDAGPQAVTDRAEEQRAQQSMAPRGMGKSQQASGSCAKHMREQHGFSIRLALGQGGIQLKPHTRSSRTLAVLFCDVSPGPRPPRPFPGGSSGPALEPLGQPRGLR